MSKKIFFCKKKYFFAFFSNFILFYNFCIKQVNTKNISSLQKNVF
jgi:hypothetical protein